MMRGMGSHHATNGQYDTWLTPLAIVRALGGFDLDPCASPSPRPWPTAERHIELPENGLLASWKNQRIWLNPPYGAALSDWLRKMAEPDHTGIAMTFARTETEAWQRWVFPFAK